MSYDPPLEKCSSALPDKGLDTLIVPAQEHFSLSRHAPTEDRREYSGLVTRRPPAGVIFHSDRGCQYTSKEFADFCAINGVRRSMGRRATCYDNAVAESFFATYKKELIHTRPWSDLTEVQQHTFLWIEGYYNRRRRHSTLDYLTPLEYELGYRKLTDLAA